MTRHPVPTQSCPAYYFLCLFSSFRTQLLRGAWRYLQRATALCAVALVVSGCASSSRGGLAAQRNDIVIAALAQIGEPYRYGGGRPGTGFDCSGLTQYAHAAAGLSIPRVSTAQQAAASPVSPRKVKPGDLVFFKTGIDQYHVGIMVDDERFVHASTSQREVRLASLKQDYWQRHLLGAGTFVKGPRLASRAARNGNSPFGEL